MVIVRRLRSLKLAINLLAIVRLSERKTSQEAEK